MRRHNSGKLRPMISKWKEAGAGSRSNSAAEAEASKRPTLTKKEGFTKRSRSSFRELSSHAERVTNAYRKASKGTAQQNITDDFYASCLCLRTVNLEYFLRGNAQGWAMPITSINEDKLLTLLGLPRGELDLIEGLQIRSATAGIHHGVGLTEEQLSSRAVARLAANPTAEVGRMQQRTALWLLRPYPLGLRFSGNNMNPIPGWLSGAQSICLNMSNNDHAVQLHFALFNGSSGYVLKPRAMRASSVPSRTPPRSATQNAASQSSEAGAQHPHADNDEFWPPLRETLHTASICIISLHNCPKRDDSRPALAGSRGACHNFVQELSGAFSSPSNLEPSTPVLSLSLYAIGGLCATTSTLPLLQQQGEPEVTLSPAIVEMTASFDEVVHCVAAEPHATFLRVAVTDRGYEVAYNTLVLGRLRFGYRVVRLRHSLTGTRIELAYLFVKISFGSEPNVFVTPRHMRLQSRRRASAAQPHIEENVKLKELLEDLRRKNSVLMEERERTGKQIDLRPSRQSDFRPSRQSDLRPSR